MARPFVYIGTIMLIFSILFFFTTPLVAVLSSLVAFVLFLIFTFIKNKNSVYIKIFALVVILSSSLFFGKFFIEYVPLTNLADENLHNITATLCEYPTEKYDSFYYTLKLKTFDDEETKGKIRYKSNTYIDCQVGDLFSLKNCTVYTLSDTQKSKGLFIGCYSDNEVTVISQNTNKILNFFNNLREQIKLNLITDMSDECAGICLGMLTGDTSLIHSKTLTYFRYSGISHIFAVSGLHLTLWVTIIFTIINSKKKLRLKGIISIIFVIFFIFLAGFSKSVLRAGIMNIVFSSGLLLNKKADSLNSLFISVTLLLFINPFTSADVSFLMSFLSCFGLITFGNYFLSKAQKFSYKINSHFSFIINLILTSLTISLTVAVFLIPISCLYTGYFSILSPVTNLLCIIPSQILIVLTVISIILSPLKCNYVFIYLCEKLSEYITYISQKSASVNFSNVAIDNLPLKIILFVLFIITIIISYLSLNQKLKLQKYFALICAFTFSLMSVKMITDSNKIKITVPDTGNGSCVILDYKNNITVIGCGGNYDKNYDFEKFIQNIHKPKLSLLLIPRNNDTESNFADTVTSVFDFENKICSKSYKENISDNKTIFSDDIKYNINNECYIEYKNTVDYSYAYIYSDEFTTLILFKPVDNLNDLPDYMQKCDYLISRSAIGKNINTANFKNIIVQTDRQNYNNKDIRTTSDEGNIVLNIK